MRSCRVAPVRLGTKCSASIRRPSSRGFSSVAFGAWPSGQTMDGNGWINPLCVFETSTYSFCCLLKMVRQGSIQHWRASLGLWEVQICIDQDHLWKSSAPQKKGQSSLLVATKSLFDHSTGHAGVFCTPAHSPTSVQRSESCSPIGL